MSILSTFLPKPTIKRGLFFLVASTVQPFLAFAGSPSNAEKGIALHGFDPVSYFTEKPLKGSDSIAFTFGDAKYLFANKENLESFQAQPQKYEPQFKGWCAYAMANGELVDVDPETFKLINGKLYLFYNGFFGNTLKKWNKDETNLLSKANTQWKKLGN